MQLDPDGGEAEPRGTARCWGGAPRRGRPSCWEPRQGGSQTADRVCRAGALTWARGGPPQPARPHVAPGALFRQDQGAVPWSRLGRAGRVVALHPCIADRGEHSPPPPKPGGQSQSRLRLRSPSTRVGLMEPPDSERMFLLFPVWEAMVQAAPSFAFFPAEQTGSAAWPCLPVACSCLGRGGWSACS